MNIVAWKNRLMPTTTAHQSRFQIFEATFAPQWREREINTPFGRGIIRGRLGQSHALFLEALCFHAIARKTLENGTTLLVVDPFEIRKTMARKTGQRYTWSGRDRKGNEVGIVRLARDLREASITIEVDGWPAVGGLFNGFSPHPTATRTSPIHGRRPRKMYIAEITAAFGAWLNHDPIHLHYDPQPLSGLRHAVSAAVARWVLGNRDEPHGGWRTNTAIYAVGGDITGQRGRDRRRDLRRDKDALEAAGVVVCGDRIHLKRGVDARLRGPNARGRGVDARLRGADARPVEWMPASVERMPASVGVIQESPSGDLQDTPGGGAA